NEGDKDTSDNYSKSSSDGYGESSSDQNPSTDNPSDDNESSSDNISDNNSNAENNLKISVQGILQKEINVEPNFLKIIDVFKKYKDTNSQKNGLLKENIMDLTPKSKFVKEIPKNIYEEFLNSLNKYDTLIPIETHDFLVKFFSQDLTYNQWTEAVDRLYTKDYTETTTKMAAFSLGNMNPLHSKDTLEKPYLNDYIHPSIKSALWHGARIYYTSGEIPLINHVKNQKGDGIGFSTGSDKYQFVYVEGTRPYKVNMKKKVETQNKIAKNLKKLLIEIVKDRVNNRKEIIPEMEVFGISCIELTLHLYVLGFSGM
ncbi:12979_t:CDS:2, partial [Racocetra fulgida]